MRESLVGLIQPSQYVRNPTSQEQSLFEGERSTYLVVYPFTKSTDWYLMGRDARQGIMNEHMRIGHGYPQVRQLLAYSFGLDDQDFIVAYETDDLPGFVDLVRELRGSDSRRSTVRDTPILTAVHRPIGEILRLLGAAGEAIPAGALGTLDEGRSRTRCRRLGAAPATTAGTPATSAGADTTAAGYLRRAAALFPGGVNSPVRAYRAVGGDRSVIVRGSGATVTDVDGTEYLDYVGAFGPLILGHAHPAVVQAAAAELAAGGPFGATTPAEVTLGEAIREAMPSIERLRFVSSGTEAVMSALRVARAATRRDLIVKFEGGYHGHADGLLAEAGSGLATLSLPASAGVPADVAAQTVLAAATTTRRPSRTPSRGTRAGSPP